jgi:RNA polymerase sigma-70 factor (ECF subfamily)
MALKMLGNTGEAEDLTQEVFLEAWQGDRFDPSRGALLTFLLTLTRSRALNRQQQNKSRQQRQERYSTDRTQTTEDLPFQTAAVAEVSERVRQALASLPEPRRTVLELAYYRGLSQSEVAAVLNLPLGTVKTRTRQALVSLRERLADLVDASP